MPGPLRLVVFGGSGFLGSQICRAATSKAWHVTSISRSGSPFASSSPSTSPPPAWASSVNWAKADIFSPDTYAEHLKDADAVVHSMGILLEANYKPVLQGKGINTAGENPLKKVETGGSSSSGGGVGGGKLTYERMNRDSAITLAKAFSTTSQSPSKTMVYISAAAGFVLLPSRYISTKREAESALYEMSGVRSIAMRPGFLYSSDRAVTVPLSYLVSLSSTMNGFTRGIFSGLLGAAAEKPLEVGLVGNAVVQAIEHSSISGAVETEEILRLGGSL